MFKKLTFFSLFLDFLDFFGRSAYRIPKKP